MSFPADPLAIRGELKINGVWTNVTQYLRNEGDINITRCFTAEQGNTITTDSCDFNLNNRDSRFANKNPTSPYYKQLGRNTRWRCSVDDANGSSLQLYNFYHSANGYASTADKAVLDIVGDIDIRGDMLPDSWTPGSSQVLASKWLEAGNQRSWYVALTSTGNLQLTWSATGSSTVLTATSTAVVATAGREAWRVTLDVDNGAAGWTATFYTASTIGGSFVQLGSAVTTATITSIFSSSANLVVGSGSAGSVVATSAPYVGNMYRVQVRNGIAGTLVADANFGAQAVDATTWSDGLTTPNTWTVNGSLATIFTGSHEFTGEVSEFPQTADSTGVDIYMPMEASSVMRRLQQGESPLKSAMRRYILSKSTCIGYWSMENGASADIAGTRDAGIQNVTFGTDSTLPSSAGTATLDNSAPTMNNIGGSSLRRSTTNVSTGIFLVKFAAAHASASEIFRWITNGTVNFWTINFDNTGYYVAGFDSSGTVLGGVVTASWPAGVTEDSWIAFRLTETTSAGNIDVRIDWNHIGDSTNHSNTTGTAYCAGSSVGRISDFVVNPNGYAENEGAQITQVAILQESITADSTNFVAATEAFLGETAGTRFLRVASDAGITAECYGDPTATVQMGVQIASTSTAVMQECEDAEGGFIYAPREFFGLAFRTRAAMQNLPLIATLSYTSNTFTYIKPTDDDKVLRNDVTITSPDGTMSSTSTHTTGPNNINSPDTDAQGVGRYDAAYSLNVENSDLLDDVAQFATFLGTWDEIRVPQVGVSLERSVFVSDPNTSYALSQMDIGDSYKISNLPTWFSVDPIELLVRGVQKTLQNRGYQITWINQAYGPFRSIDNLTSSANSRFRVAGSNSSLNASMASTGLSTFTVNTPTGKLWGTTALKPGNFPLDVFVGGERITISGITGTGAAQVFTPSVRSVNGVVKAHNALDEVQLAEIFYVAF